MSRMEIELFSDTKTRPTHAMRQAMAQAEVGDEQQGNDPSVNALCARVAELLGKPAAVFLPSGTMCNQIALLLHCQRGDEVICDQTSHLINFEAGGGAALAGAMFSPLAGKRGIFTAAQVQAALRAPSRYSPRSRLLSIEQTTNLGGGAVWSLEQIRAVTAVARDNGLALHMDGARLMNAVVASGVPAKEFAADMDTVWLDLTKGLGCPIGAVLAGSQELIDGAWQWKQRIGGAMRQAGIVAAAGLYALDHHVERLAQDHAHAAELARGLAGIAGIVVEPVETNIVLFNVAATGQNAESFCRELMTHGLRLSAVGANTLRAVTHLDVSTPGLHAAIDVIRRVATQGRTS